MNSKIINDFRKHSGLSSMKLHYYNQNIISANKTMSMTPYILEERDMRMTQMDIFSRLMAERIIWLHGTIEDEMAAIVQAQLMFLDTIDKRDITMHVDSYGGSVKSGLGMIDVMDYIKADIRTINTGAAYSMGSVILGAGTKGKRKSLRHSKVMLHQSSGGFNGNIQDAEIHLKEWAETNETLIELLAEYCNKEKEMLRNDMARDFWMNSQEALNYGIIDEIIVKTSIK